MSAALLQLDDVRLAVTGRVLIDALTLRVDRGQLWCMLGRNGAGKTMLFQAMMGFRAPVGGVVTMEGRPLAAWRRDDAARFRAFLPQSISDAFSLSVIDAVLLARHPRLSRWHWESDGDRAVARAALDAMELSEMIGRDVMTLSGGERQRVAVAAAIAQDTPLTLLDEPLANLDLNHQIMVMRRLHAIAVSKDRGVMLSIHDVNLALRFATHAMLFGEGGRVAAGPILDVVNEHALSEAYGHPVTRVNAGDRVVFVAD